jgi:hypothetical protein
VGLGLEPGALEWWLTRPIWLAVLYAVLLPVTFLLAPLERLARPADAPVPAAARQVGGAVLICLGVAYLALFGFGSAPLPGLDIAAFVLVIAGSWTSGLLHGFR